MKRQTYQIYISDALRIIGENTAKYAGGSYMNSRYADIISPKTKDERTGAEIAADVIKRAGLEVI